MKSKKNGRDRLIKSEWAVDGYGFRYIGVAVMGGVAKECAWSIEGWQLPHLQMSVFLVGKQSIRVGYFAHCPCLLLFTTA